MGCAVKIWQNSVLIYNQSMPEERPHQPFELSPPESEQTPGPALDPISERPASPTSEPVSLPATAITEFRIGEEFGTAKRNLPPVRIVLICIAAVAVVVGIYAFKERPKPQGTGSIDFVAAAEVPGQDTILVAITTTLKNTGEKPLVIHTITAQLTSEGGKTFEDEATPAVDFERYYRGFPALKESSEAPLIPDTKLPPRGELRGTIIVSFKVTKEAFDRRKSLTVTIQPYDQVLPVLLK
jgi:hypothetical protein